MPIWISCKPQTTRRSGQLDLAKPACSQREIKVIYFLFVIVLNNPQHVTRSGGYFLLHFFVHYMLYYTFLVCHRRQSAECSFNKPNCSNNNNDNSELAAELDRGLVAWYTWSRSSRKKSEKKNLFMKIFHWLRKHFSGIANEYVIGKIKVTQGRLAFLPFYNWGFFSFD